MIRGEITVGVSGPRKLVVVTFSWSCFFLVIFVAFHHW